MTKKCVEKVYRRDTYRRTGRGPSGFEMHYSEGQCKRTATEGSAYCWQHGPGSRYYQGEPSDPRTV